MDENKKKRKGESRLEEVRRKEEEGKREVERKKKEERLRQLYKQSSPLVDYGLLDAYQFFLSQLAASGMPQANIFEFAAQTMLKFQKGKVKRDETLRQVERVNQQASKVVMQSGRSRSKPKLPRQIKPQLLPFKGNLSRQEMDLMGIK